MGAPPIISLLTDFGLGDTYVGQMKAAILSINPLARIVDLTHEVAPHQVREGAFLLESALPAFPVGTIHVAVVDPGVGSGRAALAVRTPAATFVGPDNGLLSAALPAAARPAVGGAAPAAVVVPVLVVRLQEARYQRPAVAATFHGRDIFGPAAAHLSLGVPPAALGPPVTEMLAFPPFRATRLPDGRLLARVIAVDRFGNLITDCRAGDLPAGRFVVRYRRHAIPGPVRTYAEAAGVAALVGSGGYLELAAPGASAARLLRAERGAEVLIEPEAGGSGT